MSYNYDDVTLPRWVRMLFVLVRDMPSTNAKLAFSMVMTAATGATLLVCLMRNIHPDGALLDSWYVFIGGWAALGTIQYGVKRATFKPDAVDPNEDGTQPPTMTATTTATK